MYHTSSHIISRSLLAEDFLSHLLSLPRKTFFYFCQQRCRAGAERAAGLASPRSNQLLVSVDNELH